MNSARLLSLLFSLVFLCRGFAAEADPSQGLDSVIALGIRQLEAKEYMTFLQTVVPPDELKKISEKEGGLAALAKSFGEGKAVSLLAVLKAIQARKPTFENDGKTATFTIPDATGSTKGVIKFTRIENNWYIIN